MFGGIIEGTGIVRGVSRRGASLVFEIEAGERFREVATGESVSVDGVCLTATRNSGGRLWFDVMPETARSTTLGSRRVSDAVNLERSLRLGDRVSGHFVLGHVDCVGVIRRRAMSSGNLAFDISVPPAYLKYILPKGSVAVDGISLTVMRARPGGFSVYIIPHTLEQTTLKDKGPAAKVNVEFDVLAKRA